MSREAGKPEADQTPGAAASAPEGGDGFLSRWSKRKLAARSGDPAPSGPEPVAPEPEPAAGPPEEERELTDADMPPIESLTADSDYSGFFSPKVSEELRQLALRKLFHLPGVNVTDGLDDYAEDYTRFTKLGEVVTHEMRRMLEREKERAPTQEVGPMSDDTSTREEAPLPQDTEGLAEGDEAVEEGLDDSPPNIDNKQEV